MSENFPTLVVSDTNYQVQIQNLELMSEVHYYILNFSESYYLNQVEL